MLAHLILAHTPTKHLDRIVRRILHEDCDVFIHVDKKAEIRNFRAIVGKDPRVNFIKNRTHISWGGFSMVEATLSSFQEMILTGRKYDFINLLSQSDYPLAHPNTIDRFLNQHKGKSFMTLETRDISWRVEMQRKIKKIHLIDYRFKGKHALERLINIFPTNRSAPFGMELVGSSQWFALALHHVEYILKTVAEHSNIRRFFRHTWGSDEFFFQTILYNSPYRDEIVDDNLRYMDWSESQPSPKILTISDFDTLRNSGKFYARKFDQRIDSLILDKIDEMIEVR